jgi:hypothetical protein
MQTTAFDKGLRLNWKHDWSKYDIPLFINIAIPDREWYHDNRHHRMSSLGQSRRSHAQIKPGRIAKEQHKTHPQLTLAHATAIPLTYFV